MPLEAEVKFALSGPAALEALAERIAAQGGVLVAPRSHEYNLRFDDPDGGLAAAGTLLRLRQDRAVRLTLKTLPRGPAAAADGELKVREELEMTLGDFATARAILEGLGYQVCFIYEKYRRSYRLGECEIELDELPIGAFAEIEGPPAVVPVQAEALGFDWSERLVDSYAGLFERVRARLRLKVRDLTFEAFQGVVVDPGVLRNPKRNHR
jgi:adenylate cyclase class 2